MIDHTTTALCDLYIRARRLGTIENLRLTWFIHSEWIELVCESDTKIFEHTVGSNAPAKQVDEQRAFELLERTASEV